jgi:hypothetical protein
MAGDCVRGGDVVLHVGKLGALDKQDPTAPACSMSQ